MSKQIVTFVDASQQEYGPAVYIRCEYDNKSATNTSRLMAARSKVAPITQPYSDRWGVDCTRTDFGRL